MKKLMQVLAFSSVALSAVAFAGPSMELYKSPTCGCCTKWEEIMQSKGYEVTVNLTNAPFKVALEHGMPQKLMSCHTSVIDGYVIEGHVPGKEIARLLKEKPTNIAGISVPGMPMHSPGMVVPGQPYKDFQVVAFDKSGELSIYASY